MNNFKVFALMAIVFVQFTVIYNLKQKLHEKQSTPPATQQPPESVQLPPPPTPVEEPKEPVKDVEKKPKEVATYLEAISTAKIQNKKVLICFTADWCHNCVRLKNETLSDKEVQEKLSDYILLYLNTDKEKKLARQYEVYGIPHYVIIDSDEIRYATGTGFMPKNEFLNWLDKKGKTSSKNQSILQPDP